MSVLDVTLGLDANPGVYRVGETAATDARRRRAPEQGFRPFVLDGTRTHDKTGFLATIAEAMAFPEYVGRNWDALDECLGDLDWAPAAGYVIVYDHFDRFVRADPTAWETAVDLFRDAVAQWRAKGIPMFVLLRGDASVAPELPTLPLPRLEMADAPSAPPRLAGP